MTVIVTSSVWVLQPFETANLYVREVGGVTVREPAAATGVTAPVARSVTVTLEAFEEDQERLVDWPALMVVADAEKESAEARGLTVTPASAVTLPVLFVTVSR